MQMTMVADTPRVSGLAGGPRERLATAARESWQRLRARRAEIGVVVLLTIAIQVLAFGSYYRGTASPSFDFLSTYAPEAYAWWRDGGLFDPPSWVPHTWGGFPAAAQIQNSSWYVPVGLAAWLTPFDIRAAAVLQGLHVAAAGIGVYVLGRRSGSGPAAAAFGLVAYSFVTGFFTEAPYIDIVRGFALLPWILLCLSPLWPWRRWWAIPAGALLLWQAAVGLYPGVLVAIAYASVAWVAGWQLVKRPALRDFLVPLVLAGAVAVPLTAAKFVSQLEFGMLARTGLHDLSVLSATTLGSVVLPAFPGMKGVFSLNTLFIPAAAVVLALLFSLRRRITKVALATFVAALLLSLPIGVLRAATDWLPGINASRFRLNDYFPVLALMGVIAAMSGIERLPEIQATARPRRRITLVALACVPLAAACLALTYGSFAQGDWRPTFVALAATTAFVALVLAVPVRTRPASWLQAVSPTVLIILTAFSGLAHASTVRGLWAVDTVEAQESLWGATSGELIEDAEVVTRGDQRPPRTPIDRPVDQSEIGSTEYTRAFYTGELSVAGYFNVKNSASYITASQALVDPAQGRDALAFWEAPGILFGAAGGTLPSSQETLACAGDGECGDFAEMTPVAYTGDTLVYDVSTERVTAALANEAYYRGWEVVLTSADGSTSQVTPDLGPAGGIVFQVPPGHWRVSMSYETPLADLSRVLFILGLVGLAVPALLEVVRRLTRRSSLTRGAPNDPSGRHA